MCKICGRTVTKEEAKEVRIGGRARKLCESCVGKQVPMMRNIPGKDIRGVPALEGLR